MSESVMSEEHKGIHLWFPTAIYYEDGIVSFEERKKLISRCYEIKNTVTSNHESWDCDVYTSYQKHNLMNDTLFKPLINKITDSVYIFAQSFTSNYRYTCSESWININRAKHYQEYHYHPDATFSAIYYLSAPEGSGNTVFRSPLEPDMLSIKNLSSELNYLSNRSCIYPATTDRLIIFRSYLEHMVKQGTNTEDRISLSFNF